MADETLLAPPTWDDIEKDQSFTSLDPMQKMVTLNNWSGYAKKYFEQEGLWDKRDTKQQFHDSISAKAKEYGDQPVTYEQGTQAAREGEAAQQKALADQPKTPLDIVTGLAEQLRSQDRTKASLAGLGVMSSPGPLADADFKNIPEDKRQLYTQKAQQAREWNDGTRPAFSLEGNIYVQPELTLDPESYKKAVVDETDATPQEKAKTLANYPQIQQQTADQMLGVLGDTDEYKAFARDNPLANYGDDPTARLRDYLKKSKDLGSIENIRAIVGQVGLGAKLGWQQTAQSGYGVARAVAQLVPGEGIAQDAIQDVTADTNAEASKLSQQSELLGGAKPVADITAGVVSSGIPLLAGGAAGIAVKGLSGVRALAGAANLLEKAGGAGFAGSVVGSGFQQFGSAYLQAMEDYQKQGKTEDEAARAAFIPAITTGLSTAIITTLGGKYGVESVFRNEAKEAAKKTVLGITKELGIDFSAEAAEEFTDQLVQGIVEKATTSPDKSQEQIINEAVYAGVIGGVAGGLFGGAHQAVEALHKEPTTPPEIRKEVEQASKDVKVERLDAAAANADENYAPRTGATVAKIAEHVENLPASEASPELAKELDESDEYHRKLQKANEEEEEANEAFRKKEEDDIASKEPTTTSAQNGSSVVPESGGSAPAFISKQVEQQLADLGYPRDAINKITPADAQEVIKNQTTYKRPIVEQANEGFLPHNFKTSDTGDVLAVASGKKPIALVSSKLPINQQTIRLAKSRGMEVVEDGDSSIIFPKENRKQFERLQELRGWAKENLDSATPEQVYKYHKAVGGIFGYPQNEVEQFSRREEARRKQANDRSTDNTANPEVVPQATGEGIPAVGESSQRILEQPEPQVNKGAEGDETRPVVNEEAPAKTAIPSEQAATELAPAEVEQPAAEAQGKQKLAKEDMIHAGMVIDPARMDGAGLQGSTTIKEVFSQPEYNAKGKLIRKGVIAGDRTPGDVIQEQRDKSAQQKSNEPTAPQPVEAGHQSTPESIPDPAENLKAEEVLHKAASVTIKAPKGATFIRVTPQKSTEHPVIESIPVAGKGLNSFQGAGPWKKVEAGTKDKKGNFIPIKGDVEVTDKNTKTDQPNKTTPNEKPVTQVASKAPAEGAGVAMHNATISRSDVAVQPANGAEDLKRRAEKAFGKDLGNVDFEKLAKFEAQGVEVTFNRDGRQSNVSFRSDGALVLNVNPDTFRNNDTPAKVAKVFEEEVIHVAQHLELRRLWEEAGRPGYYSTFARNKGIELQRDLIEQWNQIKDQKQKDAMERALVGAFNLYYIDFSEARPKINTISELVAELNDGAESNSEEAPNHIGYILELARKLHQLKQDGQITESLFNKFIKEIGKWFHEAFGDLKGLIKGFGDDGILSKTKVAKFIADYDKILNGNRPSNDFIPKGEPSERSKLDRFFAKREDDQVLGATSLAQIFGPITDEQANIVKSEETAKIIKNLAFKFSNISGMDVNDLQQEGHLKLFNAIQKFDSSRGNPSMFVNRVVGNQFKTIYEQQLRKQYESLNEPLYEGGGEKIDSVSSEPIPEGADVGRFDIIRDAVKRLPGRERTALQMRAEGYDLRTIGDLVGMSHQGVDNVIKRVTAQLRSTLAKEGITSVDDIFPGSRERTQYLPTKYGAEPDETRIVEQATEAKLASDDYSQDLRAATKKEDDGVRTFSKREEARRSQVGGAEEVGHLYNPVKMEPAKEAVRDKAFNGSQQPSEESTAQAWDYIGRLTDLETGEANKAAGEINRSTGTDLGAALLQNELLGYSVRLAATGDAKMLNHLLATVNLMPTSELGTGQSANALFLRSRAEFESHLITGAKAVIDQADEQTARILAGGTPTLGDLAKIKEIKQELTRMKLTPEDALEGLQKRFEGIEQTIQKTFQREGITVGNDMLEAIRQLAQMGYDGKGEFTFTYNPEAGPNASEKAIKNLVATGVKSYADTLKESGANALNSTFWKTLASTENKVGPLAEIDQAQTAQLAAIVQQTLKGMGLQGTPPNTKLTDIEKVASILGKQELSKEKVKLADEKIRESIKDNMEKAIESAPDEKSKLAAKAYYSSLLTAWDASMQRQLNMPVSDAMMRRLISTELSEANTTLRDLYKGNKGDEVAAKKAAVDSILKKLGAVSWKETEYKALESWLNKTFDWMMQTKAAEIAAQKLKSDAKKAAAQTPDATAEGIIEGMAKSQSDTQGWSKPQQNAIKKIIKDDLSNTPNMARKGPWQSQLIASLVNAGVSEETAQRLADVTWREHQIKAANREIKAEQDAAEKGPLAAIVDSILATPISQQSSPTWVNDAIMQYLRGAGLSTEQATNIAKTMAPVLKKRFEEAQVKAAEKSVRLYSPWAEREKTDPVKAKSDLEKILQAVRSRALDPSSSFSDEIAKKNGWTGFSAEQFKQLAELDDIINSETSTLQAKTKAQDEIMDIVRKAKIQPSWKATISEYYTGQALGGIPTAAVNIASPAIFLVRDVITDGAAAIATNPAQLPNVVRNFVNSLNGWVSEVSFALKNDAYTKETNEFLAGNKNLKAILESGLADWKKGDHKKAMPKIIVGLVDFTRRTLSALDQGSVSVVEQYNLSRYAQSAMKKAGIPQSEINQALSYVIEVKNRYYQNAVAAGMAPNEAGAASNDAARDAWRGALADKKISGTNVERAALLDGLGVVGRKGKDKEEDLGFLSFPAFWIMKKIAGDNKDPAAASIFTRMMYGFFMIPARTVHNGAWYSPYGFVRLGINQILKNSDYNPYARSLATDIQTRARMNDAIAGTIVTLLLGLGASGSGDDDDKKYSLVVTGNGPSQINDKAYYDAWIKKYQPWSIYLKVNGARVGLNVGRGGEAILWATAFAAALDDWKLKSKKNQGRRAPKDLNGAAEVIGSIFSASMVRGPYSAFTRGIYDYKSPVPPLEQLASKVSFTGKTFIPILGNSLTKNISDFFSTPTDRTSMEGSLLSNIPFAAPIFGKPAINALGDPIRDNTMSAKFWKLGSPIVVDIPENSPKQALYKLILKNGQGPTTPVRSTVEATVGRPISDSEWYNYAKAYGDKLSAQMMKNLKMLDRKKPAEFNDELNRFNDSAKEAGMKAIPDAKKAKHK